MKRVAAALVGLTALGSALSVGTASATSEPEPDRESVEDSFRAALIEEYPDADSALSAIACQTDGGVIVCFGQFFADGEVRVVTGTAPERDMPDAPPILDPMDWPWELDEHTGATATDVAAAPVGAVDHTAEAAFEAFVEVLARPSSASLFDGVAEPTLGSGGCVPTFGVDFMCVTTTSNLERMFMAIVQPTPTGWELGQVWSFDESEVSLEPGISVADAAPVEAATPLECEGLGDYVSPVDGDLNAILERAGETADGDEDFACALATVCTSDPNDPLTAALFAAQVDGEPLMYLMLSSVCPGLLDETGVSPA